MIKPPISFLLKKCEPSSYMVIGAVITFVIIALYNLIIECKYSMFMAFCGWIGLITGLCIGIFISLGLMRWYLFE